MFKVFLCDTGLPAGMPDEGTQDRILQGNPDTDGGAVLENLIADMFGKTGRKLYYFRQGSNLDADFVIGYRGEVTPAEVKAASGNGKSTETILNTPGKYHVSRTVILGAYNVGESGQILTLPLYMAFLLRDF